MEAAQKATELRESCVRDGISFTFETVLSTRRNLDLLLKAKECGFLKSEKMNFSIGKILFGKKIK